MQENYTAVEEKINALCIRCGKVLRFGGNFCPYCGKKQEAEKVHRRGNGMGSVYRVGTRWAAAVVLGWHDGKPVRIKREGYRTKREALEALPELRGRKKRDVETLAQIYDRWKAQHEKRAGASTMAGYASAWKHYSGIQYMLVDQIVKSDLQECIDSCTAGKRTKQNMRTLAGLLMRFAMDEQEISMNPALNLWAGDDETTHRAPITEEELQRIWASGLPYSKYVVCACYLGYRPGEFCGLRKDQLMEQDGIHFFRAGIKTDAGKDRAVTIPPVIWPLIQKQMETETEYVFPRESKKGKEKGWRKMESEYYREEIFKPIMAALGIEGKVPYGARHTYSNKLKAVSGSGKDKAELMGHADYTFTEKVYQTSDLESMKAITDQMV